MLFSICNLLASWAIPALLFIIPLVAWLRGVPLYETFVAGASEGVHTALRIMPCLIAMMVAIAIFRDSGALAALLEFALPLLDKLGVPAELMPLAIMRPLSGTGAMGLAAELLQTFGPDSFYGKVASTVIGSTDTTFYIITVYFGAVGISKVRYAIGVGLVGDGAAFFLALYLCRSVFS